MDIPTDEMSTQTQTDQADEHPVVAFNAMMHELFAVPIPVGKATVCAYIDSGAMLCLMQKKVFDLFPKGFLTLKPFHGIVQGVSGSPVKVYGIVEVPYVIDGYTYITKTVIADCAPRILLGMNFLRNHRAIVNYDSGEMSIGSHTFLLTKKTNTRCTKLVLVNNLTVGKHSEQVVMLKAPRKKHQIAATTMVTPIHKTTQSGLVFGNTLSKPNDDGHVMATVINPTTVPIHLDKGCPVALAMPVTTVAAQLPDHAKTEEDSSPEALPSHVEALIENANLSHDESERLRAVLQRHANVFAPPTGPTTITSEVQHEIDTGDERPIRLRTRRLPIAQQELATEEVNKMLKSKVIEESDSPWAAPIVLVKKKDGTVRFCVDYRKLNSITRKDSYPLPNIDDTLASLAGAKYFCALDLASGYWQVPLSETAKPKSAFVTKDGLFQFKVMPFGLCNAPATFERLMERVLKGHLGTRCLVYIDDVIVFGPDFTSTLNNLDIVLQALNSANLQLKSKKCDLFKTEILYLGFKISGQGVSPDPRKTSAVENWPKPCNVSDIRTFLGFASYHRRFIKNFAGIADPLTRLTKKKSIFQWTETEQFAFDTLKQALITAPMMHHPAPKAPFILDTDASAYAIGGQLSQVVDGVERVVAYASQTLSKSQRNYCTTNRELLAVVQMIRHYRHYLYGRKFLLRTDHSSLRWLLNYKDADGMLSRWLTRLSEYDFEIEYRPGKQHLNADGLSRCHSCKNQACPGFMGLPPPTPRKTRSVKLASPIKQTLPMKVELNTVDCPAPPKNSNEANAVKSLEDKINELPWLKDFSMLDIKSAQRQDTHIKPVIKWIEDGTKPDTMMLAPHSEETKALASRWNHLSVNTDGILIKTGLTSRSSIPIIQIVLPTALREVVLHQLHDLRVSGHLGINRTIARVQQRFYWPGCSLDVARWCAACTICAARKGKPGPGRVPMTSLPTGAPFERIAVDILDTRKLTSRKFQYILVISDYFTKYTDAFPLRRHTAPVVADTIMRRWIAYHGVPKQLHSDQGTEFEGHLIKALSKLLGFAKIRTSPYRPQSDGQVERFNRSLLNMLSAFVSDRANDWDEHLPYVLMAYRSSRHSSTGCTPYSMTYGRECTMPVDLLFPDPTVPSAPNLANHKSCGPEYVEYIRRLIQTSHTFARDHLHRASVRQKKGYDAYAKDRPKFQPGDLVRYYYPPSKTTNKFARPWIGPFLIQERVTPVDYRIVLVSDQKKIRVVHIDNLKPYELPYSKLEISPQQMEETMKILDDDHPDHLDPPVDRLHTDVPTAPEQLQSTQEMMEAHRKLKRPVPPRTPRRRPPPPNPMVHGTPLPVRRPQRTITRPKRYLDNCVTFKLFSSHPLL